MYGVLLQSTQLLLYGLQATLNEFTVCGRRKKVNFPSGRSLPSAKSTINYLEKRTKPKLLILFNRGGWSTEYAEM